MFGHFVTWGDRYEHAFDAADAAGARPVLHISTAQYYGRPERITPLGIARGLGDGYLIALARRIAARDAPTYVRLLSEMNQTNNGYCAFNRDGSARGPSHSTAAFRQAWRRAALVLRGGPVARINARLRGLGQPAVRGMASDRTLPRPKVALLWVPQTRGSPDIPANMPERYWPGARYVDWVGTDFYSRFPRFDWLEAFHRRYSSKPFMFGEWALWGRDDPSFVTHLFSWMRGHPRVRMWHYNQGNNPVGPFRLKRHPRARRAIRAELRCTRWLGAGTFRPGSPVPFSERS